MYYVGLASDYDGTLAHEGAVDDATLESLQRFKKSGRKLILVTGRIISDLQRVFPQVDLFDVVVAENGALLFLPGSKTERALAPPPRNRRRASRRRLRILRRQRHGISLSHSAMDRNPMANRLPNFSPAAIVAFASGPAAAGRPLDYLVSSGTMGRQIAPLLWGLLTVSAAVVVIVSALVLTGSLKRPSAAATG